MKCKYCELTFEGAPTKKVIRGKQHVFCSEECFRYYHYRIPKFDTQRVLGERAVRISSLPDFRVLIEEDGDKEGE